MPAIISHYLQAEKTLHLYLQQGGTPVDKDAFFWGAQGPDFLFLQLSLPWRRTTGLRKIGQRMHKENPTQLLGAMRDYVVRNSSDNTVRSYFFGFLCHYSFDRSAHPYVYAQVSALKKQYPHSKEQFLHSQIETALDVILLRYERGELPTQFNLKRAYPKNSAVQQAIAEFYASVLQQVYGKSISVQEILQTERDCRFLTGLQNDRTGVKKRFFLSLEKKRGSVLLSCIFRGIMEDENFDYANILSGEWSWPCSCPEKRTDSFFDLFEASVQESLMFLQKLSGQTDVESFFGPVPFS